MELNWKRNLASVWLGCFFTGLAMSQIMPFLPLYVEQLGIHEHGALSLWSGLVFSSTFLVAAIVAPLWGSLADRMGRRPMLLRAALGMAIAIALQGMATNVYQLVALRALMGLASGFIPNGMALVASQAPRERSGWALGTLSTAQVTGVIAGPLLGGFLADHIGLRWVFMLTSGMMFISFLVTLFLIREGRMVQVERKDHMSNREVFRSWQYPMLMLTLFITTLMIQVANGSIGPVLTLFIRYLIGGGQENVAFMSGIVASLPGIAALIAAPRLGRLGDKVGMARILVPALAVAALLFIAMSLVATPWQLAGLRFLLGFADGALLPAVQTLLVTFSSQRVTGRVLGYNQSFLYLGNMLGPMMGSTVSALWGFRWVFVATSVLVAINAIQLFINVRRLPREVRYGHKLPEDKMASR